MDWNRMFVAASGLGVVIALGMVGGAATGWSGFEALCSLLFVGTADPLGNSGLFQAGIAGGVFAGWSLTLLLLARDPELSRSPTLWTHITIGIVTWFVLDSTASVLTGAAYNVIGNTAFLAMLLTPIWGIRRRGIQ